MAIPTDLLTHLHHLTLTVGDHTARLDRSVSDLNIDLHTAIPTYQGLRLTITRHDYPVVLTAMTDNADHTSPLGATLRVPLTRLGPGFEPSSRIVFYAQAAGAFVDLAADLVYSLTSEQDADHDEIIVLDADLVPGPTISGLSGVPELAAIERAVGIMIEVGHHPEEAYPTLRRHAAAAGLDPYPWACKLLSR